MSTPAAPAGWYPNPDPSGEGMRYWNGDQWADPPPPAPDARGLLQHSPAAKPDPTLAWVIAVSPLVMPLVAFFAPAAVQYAAFLVLIVALQCASSDSKRLARHGFEVSWWWAWLAGIAYLIVRAKRTSTTVAIPVVGGLALALSLLLSFTAAAVWTVPEAEVEGQIEAWLKDQGAKGRVDCDSDLVGIPGDILTCTAFIGGQSSLVTVTLEEDGGYNWELR